MTSARLSDAELLAAIAERDLGAMRELYDRHAPWLTVRLSRRCADQEVVADAVQDAFLAVWQKPGSFRGQGAVGAWLWGIAIRRLVSRLRGRREVLLGLVGEWRAGARRRGRRCCCRWRTAMSGRR